MNWFTHLFSSIKKPELSCFVKGLIRSMKETPEKWQRNRYFHIGLTSWQYPSPYVNLWMPSFWTQSVHSTSKDFPNLTRAEKKALTQALFEYLETPYQTKIVETDRAEQHKLMAPFEKLGCPDQS